MDCLIHHEPYVESLPPPLAGSNRFDRLHQADISFTDQIQQRQTNAFVIAGDLDHEAKVRLDHLFARFFVALLDFGGEFDLFVRRQEFDLSDLQRR